MKTQMFLSGLAQLVASLALAFVPYGQLIGPGPGRVVAFVVAMVLGFVNARVGTLKMAEALFGEGGLVLDVERAGAGADARLARLRPVGTRLRLTCPSAKLRERGATRRFRGRTQPRLAAA